jgi:hypothetical protein
MLPTSGTYNFQSIQIELIIREAFERIGISGEFVEPVKLESAKRSLNLLFLEWMNKSVNLWTLEKTYLPLVTGQGQYTLPVNVSNITQANLRTSTRQLNGTAASSNGGVAANAFDSNPLTACTQDAINGNISYDYGANVTQMINFIGVTSQATLTYSLTVEISQDNAAWTTLFIIPAQSFAANTNVWFDVPTPVNARAYRIRETGGSTLNIQELYFNNNVTDFAISDVTRYEYYTYPNKNQIARPSIFYLDRQILPILNIWPTPTDQYNCLQYLYKKMVEDVGDLYTNAVQIPSRFYPALIWGLTWQLALKFNPQQAAMLKGEYEQSFSIATREDSESVPMRIVGEEGYYNS